MKSDGELNIPELIMNNSQLPPLYLIAPLRNGIHKAIDEVWHANWSLRASTPSLWSIRSGGGRCVWQPSLDNQHASEASNTYILREERVASWPSLRIPLRCAV